MNLYAIKYTNQLRSKPLVSGSKAMFDNAMKHSIKQDEQRSLFHQPLRNRIRVGKGVCADTLSGENVAYFINSRIKNAAMYCVLKLWKNSSGHYRNMVNPSFTTVVVAIYRHNRRVTCTQTFTRRPRVGDGQCAAALPKSSLKPVTPSPSSTSTPTPTPTSTRTPTPTPSPTPTPTPTTSTQIPTPSPKTNLLKVEPHIRQPDGENLITKYKLRYETMTFTRVDGTGKNYIQRCFSDQCYYCIDKTGYCFSERASRQLNYFFYHYGL